jgi:hypothetical protein
MNWQTSASFGLKVDRGNRTLAITVMAGPDRKWICAAIEVPIDVSTLSDVFGAHAHRDLGSFESIAKAFAVGERFAKEWAKGVKLEKCGCKEIPKRGKK